MSFFETSIQIINVNIAMMTIRKSNTLNIENLNKSEIGDIENIKMNAIKVTEIKI